MTPERRRPRTASRVRERAPGPVLLDTAALLWWLTDEAQLTRPARDAIATALSYGVLVSAVSVWEIGTKAQRERLTLPVPFEMLVASLESIQEVTIVPVDLTVWMEVVALDWSHRDPADRIIVATARLRDVPLVSSDRVILSFLPSTIW